MRELISQAKLQESDIPIAASVVALNGESRFDFVNDSSKLGPLGHAELLALQEALFQLEGSPLTNFALISTLEPCPMCAAAAALSGVPVVVFGAFNDQYGAAGSRYDLLRDGSMSVRGTIEVIGGVLDRECSRVINQFFESKR